MCNISYVNVDDTNHNFDTDSPGLNPGLGGEKPVTNHLSYGKAEGLNAYEHQFWNKRYNF